MTIDCGVKASATDLGNVYERTRLKAKPQLLGKIYSNRRRKSIYWTPATLVVLLSFWDPEVPDPNGIDDRH